MNYTGKLAKTERLCKDSYTLVVYKLLLKGATDADNLPILSLFLPYDGCGQLGKNTTSSCKKR